MSANIRRYQASLLFLYVVVLTIGIYLAFSHWGYDDPYITYRYAANLQHGLGFVYNPGQRVQSTTTPLFTLLLALGSNLWSDLPHLANLIGAFSLALGGFFLWDLAQTCKTPIVGWCGLLLYPTFNLVVTTLGSETPLYLAFCLGAFALYARRRYPMTAIFVALAVLTRPDGILVAIILSIHYLIRVRGTIPWLSLILFFGISIPWFIFAWIYFGSPLPITLAVKQHQGTMLISENFVEGFITYLQNYNQWPFLLEAGLAFLGAAYMFWHGRLWGLLLSWTTIYFAAYAALGVSSYFWYYAPLLPGFIVLVGLGISWLTIIPTTKRNGVGPPQTVPARRQILKNLDRKNGLRWVGLILAVILIFVLVQGQVINIGKLRQHLDNRLVIYKHAGEWLRDHTPADATIGTLETGMIGYYSQRRMIDFAGLIQPQVSNQLTAQSTYQDAASWAVVHYHPEYLVLQQKLFANLEQGYVAEYCSSIHTFPGNSFGFPMNLIVYSCRK